MSEFENLEKKAQAYVEEHPEQADKAINEAGEFAERETDHQHDEQIDRAVNAAEQHIGQDQDQATSSKPKMTRTSRAAGSRARDAVGPREKPPFVRDKDLDPSERGVVSAPSVTRGADCRCDRAPASPPRRSTRC